MSAIDPREVHVWANRPDLRADEVAAARADLSGEERARADRFQRPEDGIAFTAARSRLRRVLAGYLGRPAASIRFVEGRHGKPALAMAGDERPPLAFNLSHADGLVLIAVTAGMPVGIDVERVRPVSRGVVEEVFTAREAAALAALPAHERDAAFIRGWTRKEAVLKATGAGFSVPPRSLEVSLGAGAAELLGLAGDPAEAARWRIVDLDLGPDHAGAVAAARRGWTIRWMDGAA